MTSTDIVKGFRDGGDNREIIDAEVNHVRASFETARFQFAELDGTMRNTMCGLKVF